VPSKTTRFEKLLEAVPDALVGMDQKGVIRFVNRQTESLFDYDRAQLTGQFIELLVPEPLWQIYAQNRDEYFADRKTRSTGLEVELVGRKRDGTEFPVNISMAHIDTGDVLLVITAVSDVKKQKVAIRNAQLVAAVVDASDDGIIASTLEGVVTIWNPAAERMYGYASKEMIGRSASVLSPRGAGEMPSVLARVSAGEVVEHLEMNLVRKDGTAAPVSLTVAPIRDEDGEVVGACAVHRDVTEARQAFEAAQRLAAIVEGSQDAIFGSTLEGTITSWNRAAEKLFGYSAKEMIGESGTLLSPGKRPDEVKAILARVGAGQHVEHLETTRVRKDGTEFPVSLTVSPILGADGAVVGASAINRNMTALRQAFAVAQRLAAIVESSEDAIISRALDGSLTSWNPAAERMYGYASQEVVGKLARFLIPDGRPDETDSILAKIRAGQSVEHLEIVHVRKDGTQFPVSLTVSPIRNEERETIGASLIHRDMTGHMLAFEAAQRMAAIVEYSDDAIIGRTLDGSITSWNPAAERIFGYSGEEVLGKPVDLVVPADRAVALSALLARIKTGRPVEDFETTCVRQDGTTIPVKFTVAPIRDPHGTVVGVSSIARDLTAQKEASASAQLSAVIEFSGEAITSVDLDRIITSFNPAAERLYGYSAAEVIGKHASLMTPKDRNDEIDVAMKEISAGNLVENLATLRLRKDGSVFPATLTVSPIRDASGVVVGASTVTREVTGQRSVPEVVQREAAIVEKSDDA
jgi:PAS domain S-box-containing protein